MIVVFGAQGQLGQALQHFIGEAPQHVFLTRDSRDYCGDIANTAGLTETLMDLRPSVVINAAAYTAVDQAESEAEQAELINARAPGVMAQVASKIGALLVHYSTDYVFDGHGDRPWLETDACAPLSVYGKTKHAGEVAIMQSGCRHLILRTSWVFSSHGKNFLTTMLRLANEKKELRVVSDQWGVPTHVDLLSEVTLDLINLATPGFGSADPTPIASGIYHCAPAGTTNWFDYARLVINTAKNLGHAATCERVLPIPTKDYPTPAQRPLNSRLSTEKLRHALGITLAPWQDDVIRTVRDLIFAEDSPDTDPSTPRTPA